MDISVEIYNDDNSVAVGDLPYGEYFVHLGDAYIKINEDIGVRTHYKCMNLENGMVDLIERDTRVDKVQSVVVEVKLK